MSLVGDQITKARTTVDSLLEQADKAMREETQIYPHALYTDLLGLKFALAFLAGYIGEER